MSGTGSVDANFPVQAAPDRDALVLAGRGVPAGAGGNTVTLAGHVRWAEHHTVPGTVWMTPA
jgi:hypothetical protein